MEQHPYRDDNNKEPQNEQNERRYDENRNDGDENPKREVDSQERRPYGYVDRNQEGYNRTPRPNDGERRPYNDRNQSGGYQGGGYNRTPRPNDGERRPYNDRNQSGGYQGGGYNRTPRPEDGERRPYNDRNQSGGYQGGGYNRTPRPEDGERRPYNDRNQSGGYQGGGYNRPPQDGERRPYNDRNQSGGYQGGGHNRTPRPNDGERRPYNDRNQSGGYGNRPQTGGYNNRNQGSGYGNRPQTGGYNNRNQPPQVRKPILVHKPVAGFPEPKIPLPQQTFHDPTPERNDGTIRLNKFLANAGIASRRAADELIKEGHVSVNDVVITEMGHRVTVEDVVTFKGDKVELSAKKVYILLNKPKDFITTADDPEGRQTVMDLVKGACEERIYPVGRLDRNTTGLLLLTNDGDLAKKLSHPSYMVKKIYYVELDKPLSRADMQRIMDGLELEDGKVDVDDISYLDGRPSSEVGIEIHIGKNRIVRRIFEHLGYQVKKLDRVYYAGLTKKDLARGRYRELNEGEINILKHFV